MSQQDRASQKETAPEAILANKLSDTELQDFITMCEKAASMAKNILADRIQNGNVVEDIIVREIASRLAEFGIKGYHPTLPENEIISEFDPKQPISFRDPTAGKVIQYMGQWGDGKHSFEVAYGDSASIIETRNSDGRRFSSGKDWADIVNIQPEVQQENSNKQQQGKRCKP
jgi:hypothetical protein